MLMSWFVLEHCLNLLPIHRAQIISSLVQNLRTSSKVARRRAGLQSCRKAESWIVCSPEWKVRLGDQWLRSLGFTGEFPNSKPCLTTSLQAVMREKAPEASLLPWCLAQSEYSDYLSALVCLFVYVWRKVLAPRGWVHLLCGRGKFTGGWGPLCSPA